MQPELDGHPPDPVQELGSTAVQQRAAKILGTADVGGVAAEVTGTVDPTTGQLSITATDANPARAQAVAKAYSEAYVDQIQALVQAQIDKINTELSSLQHQIAVLQQSNPSGTDAVIAAQITGLTTVTQHAPVPADQRPVRRAVRQHPGGRRDAGGTDRHRRQRTTGHRYPRRDYWPVAASPWPATSLDNRLAQQSRPRSHHRRPDPGRAAPGREVRSGEVTIAMVQAPQSQMAEAVRELRTSLRVILDDTPCPMITVTSPEPGDGKTFVTANLAAAWAMSGSKVIVVSADFRRPRLEEIFGLPLGGRPGLADLIRRQLEDPGARPPGGRDAEAQPALPSGLPYRVGDPGNGFGSDTGGELGVDRPGMPEAARPPEGLPHRCDTAVGRRPPGGQWDLGPPDPARRDPTGQSSELFGSPGMQPVIDQLRLLADVILVDTPPVLVVPDTAIIGRFTAGAVVVAAEGKTTDRPGTDRATPGGDQLPGARGGAQPGAAFRGHFVPGLQLPAMSAPVTAPAARLRNDRRATSASDGAAGGRS